MQFFSLLVLHANIPPFAFRPCCFILADVNRVNVGICPYKICLIFTRWNKIKGFTYITGINLT